MYYSLIFILAISTLLIGCSEISNNNDSKQEISTEIVNNPVTAESDSTVLEELPAFAFDTENHDFGAITQGEKVSYTFKYTNTGKSDLIISSAKASCGCTVPKYSNEPIAPNEKGEIEIIFDSSGRKGKQKKTVTVQANTQPNIIRLIITGEVLVP